MNPRAHHSSWHYWLGWALIGALLGSMYVIWTSRSTAPPSANTRPVTAIAPTDASLSKWSFHRQIDRVMPSVVSIRTIDRQLSWSANQRTRTVRPVAQEKQGLGSGVIFDNSGHIVTNAHVVDKVDQVRVTLFDGREVVAQVVGIDTDSDLAVLRIPTDNLTPLTRADLNDIHVGDIALAVGNPYGLGHSVSMGIISGLGRNYLGLAQYENYIQTDAAINRGNSGGPLINSRGELVGINTITLNTQKAQGISFAIPVDTVIRVFNDLVELGYVSRGWVGVESKTLTPEIAQRFKLPNIQGLMIVNVYPGSPGDTAGLVPGDILTHINDTRVYESAKAAQIVSQLKPGDKVKLQFVREHMHQSTHFTVIEKPARRRSRL